MGVFDSVMVPCPACGHREEFQSKGADFPYLNVYKLGEDDIPDDVLSGINYPDDAVCERCGTRFGLKITRHQPTVEIVTLDQEES